MNVSTKTIEVTDPSGAKVLKQILVSAKDLAAGEVIYDEQLSQFWIQTWKGKGRIVLNVSAR
ncbi:hypothetical protein BC826DRAFT_211055 [Russula brevipes]|nr:hypothetical protein BC826DRAFT_211055 [Russula brevipes]